MNRVYRTLRSWSWRLGYSLDSEQYKNHKIKMDFSYQKIPNLLTIPKSKLFSSFENTVLPIQLMSMWTSTIEHAEEIGL